MAMEDEESGQDRTEEASEHRRNQFREEGQVGQSRELTAAIIVLATIGALTMASHSSLMGIWSVFESSFESMERLSHGDWTPNTVMSIATYVLKALAIILAPILLACLVAGLAGNLIQTGFLWTTKPLEPNLNKLNPMNAISRLMSLDALFDFAKSLMKFVVVGALVYPLLRKWLREAGNLWSLEAGQVAAYLGSHMTKLLFTVALGMFILSLIDYGFQKFRYEQKLKMTKQEAKEDRRQTEGNPQMKARIRAVQRSRATRRMMEAVKKADVVVTNPTHIAVALIFDRENMHAPKVVAKGADHMAQRIKQVAREAGVPCVENVPLARALYKALKIGQFIPRELYNAVAEVLAYVYRLKGKFT